jgi:hypothetical protein
MPCNADRRVPTKPFAVYSPISCWQEIELRIKRGLVDREHTDIVQELERRAWEHLAAYVGAMAFALDTGEDNEQRREIES